MDDFGRFVEDYYQRFATAIASFDKQPLAGVLEVFKSVIEAQGTIWVAGNGGSAAIADHTVCDTTKGTFVEGHAPLRSISLSANGPLLTALANDTSYDQVFSKQLEFYLRPGDAVLLVSSSGNSPNVVKAAEFAQQRGVPTIAFVGFQGGRLAELADHVLWVPVENYGIVEDTHQSLMHVLTQYLRLRTEGERDR